MAPTDESVSCYQIRRGNTTSAGHPGVFIQVFEADKVSVPEKIEGAIDNKAGYGNPDAAAQVGSYYRTLLADGYTEVFESRYRHHYFWIRWAEYRPDSGTDPRSAGYLRHHVEGAESYEQMMKVLPVLEKIGRKIVKLFPSMGRGDGKDLYDHVFNDPSRFTDALDAMGYSRVKPALESRYVTTPYVIDDAPRMRFRTEGVLRLFEVVNS